MTKSLFFKTLTTFAAGLLVLACTPTVIPELSLSDLAANFEATGALEKTVSVTSNVDWTVSCPDAWVTVSPSSGTGNGAFKISVQENKAFETRTSTVTVKAGDKSSSVKVSQLGLTPSILVAPATLVVEAAGGTASVDVTSNSPWTVTVPADGSWVTPDAASGEGNKKVTFTVAPNTAFEARSVDVLFTAQDKKATVKITQAAPAPTLEVNPFAISAAAEGASFEIDVESNAPWTVTVADNWITVEPASGEGNAKVILTVAESDSRQVRTAVVTVKETVGNTEKTVNVSQDALPLGHKADSLALVAIYNASDGANWAKNKWELDKPIDTWPAVTVTAGRVTALKLTTANVITKDWTLPAEIGDLTELTDLRINSNKLTGDLPESLYELKKLEYIYFQNDNLTGALSSKIGQLKELIQLYVDRNANMTGGLPKEIGNLKKLARINISQTGIGGEIPAELGQCDALLQFMAFKTNLSGTLPDIWDMPVLQTVMLYGNPGLTGELPASLGKLKPLVNGSTVTAPSLQLYECNFTGNIPESFAGLHEKTKQVFLEKNKMSGVIPASVIAHPNFSSWRWSPQQEGYGLTLHSGSGGQDLDDPVDTDPWN